MKKPLKWVGIFISILLLLIALTVMSLVTFVSPNRFKPLITEQVMKYTGRQLTIDGDLSWTLFPYLGVKTGHMLLSNPSGFEQRTFAEIEHATIGVKLFPLLHKRVESSGITLDGLKLNLIKEANGKTNWQFQPVQTAAATNTASAPAPESKVKNMSVALTISGVDIVNAEINWLDKQKKQAASIEKFALHAKNISLLNPFAISSDFDFVSKNPNLSGHVALTSEASLNLNQQVFSFRNLSVTTKLQQSGKKYDAKITGDVIADLSQQTLEWTNFRGQMSDLTVTGKVSVVELATAPHATGHFEVLPFDVKALLQSIGQDVTTLQTLKELRGNVDFSASANAVDVQGKFNLDTVQADKIKLTNVVIPVHYQIGVLELAPITAELYQGTLQANTKVNLTGAAPQIAMQGKLANIHAEPLLRDLGGANQKLKFTGMGNVDFQVTTLGSGADTITKNLNGTAKLSFNQGVLQGVDIGYLIDNAYAVVKHSSSNTSNANQTDFGNLSANIIIRDGVVFNDDLLLNSPRFNTTGKGHIDLVNQKIDFHLQTILSKSSADQRNDWGNLYGLPIPINITGNLKSPSISLDAAVLARAVAEQQIKKIQTKVQEKIQEQVKDKAGQMLQNLLGH